ncbi:G/U mismatch-specific DNA glycosylase [Rhodanobacter ginsengiterrae]|uniref:G/U mismatch-specific DNA glycosylase n=1 Tax=Rhodanobacter ginsengiterrae TaxID=2008451 RepID=UPI003CE715FB
MADVLPDLLAEGLAVVFCGINPGVQAAASGHHFAGRGNRFWKTLHLAGFTDRQLRPEDDRLLLGYRCGLTSVVERPTARADELSTAEFLAAAALLEQKIARYRPGCIAFLGKVAYGALAGRTAVAWGRQPETIHGSSVWVLPNPSGRNRAFALAELVDAYRALRVAMCGSTASSPAV